MRNAGHSEVIGENGLRAKCKGVPSKVTDVVLFIVRDIAGSKLRLEIKTM